MEPLIRRQTGKVLIIEDDLVYRELIATVLEDAGYQVIQASDGPTGLAVLENEDPPNIILLDIRLQGMNGWNFLSRKQRIAKAAMIPVVVMSGEPPPRAPRGIVAWLEKPVGCDALLRLVRPFCAMNARAAEGLGAPSANIQPLEHS